VLSFVTDPSSRLYALLIESWLIPLDAKKLFTALRLDGEPPYWLM
jgi:hypothetical protein